MSDDEMTRKFESLRDQIAQFSAEMKAHRERTIAALEVLIQLRTLVVQELREGFTSLTVSNEQTQDLAQQSSRDLDCSVERMREGLKT